MRDLIIRHNNFDNCNYANWGRGLIGCGAGINADCYNANYYNRNILIEDNTFTIHRTPLLSLYCVDGITFVRNRIIASGTQYPSSLDKADTKALFDLRECRNFKHDIVKIE